MAGRVVHHKELGVLHEVVDAAVEDIDLGEGTGPEEVLHTAAAAGGMGCGREGRRMAVAAEDMDYVRGVLEGSLVAVVAAAHNDPGEVGDIGLGVEGTGPEVERHMAAEGVGRIGLGVGNLAADRSPEEEGPGVDRIHTLLAVVRRT